MKKKVTTKGFSHKAAIIYLRAAKKELNGLGATKKFEKLNAYLVLARAELEGR